jgi:hypothetical protein
MSIYGLKPKLVFKLLLIFLANYMWISVIQNILVLVTLPALRNGFINSVQLIRHSRSGIFIHGRHVDWKSN